MSWHRLLAACPSIWTDKGFASRPADGLAGLSSHPCLRNGLQLLQ